MYNRKNNVDYILDAPRAQAQYVYTQKPLKCEMVICVDCGKEISEDDDLRCEMCGEPICEDCETGSLCSACAELWESEMDLEDLEAEEES